jgi:hypothetical protein
MGGATLTQEDAVTAPTTEDSPPAETPAEEQAPPPNTNGKGKKKKGKRSVHAQGAGMKKNRLKAHKGGKGKAKDGRIPVDPAAYVAAQLHKARQDLIAEKNKVLEKAKLAVEAQKIALAKDEIILKLEARLLQAEARLTDQENNKLREEHGLLRTVPLRQDDNTGEVYYLEDEIEADKKAAEAEAAAKKDK